MRPLWARVRQLDVRLVGRFIYGGNLILGRHPWLLYIDRPNTLIDWALSKKLVELPYFNFKYDTNTVFTFELHSICTSSRIRTSLFLTHLFSSLLYDLNIHHGIPTKVRTCVVYAMHTYIHIWIYGCIYIYIWVRTCVVHSFHDPLGRYCWSAHGVRTHCLVCVWHI